MRRLRIQEYSPGKGTPAFAFDPERFAAHERFFVEDVSPMDAVAV